MALVKRGASCGTFPGGNEFFGDLEQQETYQNFFYVKRKEKQERLHLYRERERIWMNLKSSATNAGGQCRLYVVLYHACALSEWTRILLHLTIGIVVLPFWVVVKNSRFVSPHKAPDIFSQQQRGKAQKKKTTTLKFYQLAAASHLRQKHPNGVSFFSSFAKLVLLICVLVLVMMAKQVVVVVATVVVGFLLFSVCTCCS